MKTHALNFCIVDCEWNDWSDHWADCSNDCGGGIQTKTRTKRVEAQYNGQECEGDEEIVRSCNMTVCEDGKG